MGKSIKTIMKINNILNKEEAACMAVYEAAIQQAHETITEQGFIITKQLRAIVIVQTLLIAYLIFAN